MVAVLDFADANIGSWTDGQPEFNDDVIAVISWRGRNTAYLFAREFWQEFVEWVSEVRDKDGHTRIRLSDDDEPTVGSSESFLEGADEHLQRIGCRISEITEWPIA